VTRVLGRSAEQIPAAVARVAMKAQDFEAKSAAVWAANFAHEGPNKATFTSVFGPEILVGRERHQMGASMSKGPNDEVIVDLTVWRPAAQQPRLGFATESLGTAKLAFNDDGTFKILEKKP
jgi:hypothetical protein